MQSGIEASAELKEAFATLLSSPSQFALTATIESESIVPSESIPSQSGFPSDLALLTPKLTPTRALYLLIRTSTSTSDALPPSSLSAPLLCITYTPDAAPVRQKMVFASTRLSLVRQLGTEHFSEQIFCTVPEEVSPAGWEAHVAHARLEDPLTEEDGERAKLREDEACGGLGGGGGGGGTARREGHYVSLHSEGDGSGLHSGLPGIGGGGKDFPIKVGEGVLEALQGLKDGVEGGGKLVLLRLDGEGSTLELDLSADGVGAGELAGKLHASSPRYAFYSLETAGNEVKSLFIYTCPGGSKVKERMIYASSRNHVVKMAEAKAGLRLDRKLEGAGPEDFPANVLLAEFSGCGGDRLEEKKGFARPKRPGRR